MDVLDQGRALSRPVALPQLVSVSLGLGAEEEEVPDGRQASRVRVAGSGTDVLHQYRSDRSPVGLPQLGSVIVVVRNEERLIADVGEQVRRRPAVGGDVFQEIGRIGVGFGEGRGRGAAGGYR